MIGDGADAVEPIATPHGTLRLRPETAADVAFLAILHDSVKGPELAMTGIPETMLRNLLDMQFRAMTMSYHSTFPAASFGIVTVDDAPIGRLITDDSAGWFHVVHIALLAEWRNRGMSTALMTAVLRQPRARGLRCEAMVALDNLASQRLWSRLGFLERERDDANLIAEWRPA